MDIKNRELVKMIERLGEEQVAKDAASGEYQREYRKRRNMIQQKVLELAKTDVRMREAAEKEVDQQLGKKKTA